MATRRGNGSQDEATDGAGANVGDLSYSDAGAELDAIIEEFETGVIDVDRLVEQLQRATDIVDELDRRFVDFRRASSEDGLSLPEFDSFGPTRRTLRQFLAATAELSALVRDVLVPDPG